MACAKAIDNIENTELNLDALCDLLNEDDENTNNDPEDNDNEISKHFESTTNNPKTTEEDMKISTSNQRY